MDNPFGNPVEYVKKQLAGEVKALELRIKVSLLLLQAKILIDAAMGLTDDEKVKANCQAAKTALGD